jgi:hypothetical protein
MLRQWLFEPELLTLAVVAVGLFVAGFTASRMGDAYRSIGSGEHRSWR